jgi:hypothetical protein
MQLTHSRALEKWKSWLAQPTADNLAVAALGGPDGLKATQSLELIEQAQALDPGSLDPGSYP